jgi:hypothetical protein
MSTETEERRPARQDSPYAWNTLRAAIAYAPSNARHFAKERDRLYCKLGIPTDADGDPVYSNGAKIIREVHDTAPDQLDLPSELTEPPEGTLDITGLGDKYNCHPDIITRYLYNWRHEWPEPVAGYYRYERAGGNAGYISRAYYDATEFDNYLQALQDAGEQGARRLLSRGKFRPKRGAAGKVRGRA